MQKLNCDIDNMISDDVFNNSNQFVHLVPIERNIVKAPLRKFICLNYGSFLYGKLGFIFIVECVFPRANTKNVHIDQRLRNLLCNFEGSENWRS